MGISWARLAVLQLLCSFTISPPLVRAGSSATCDATVYGTPSSSDCSTLFQQAVEAQDLRSRLFVEEQLRAESDASWPAVDNTFAIPIVQVPKYYSKNTCNFAVMPYTNPYTRSVLPLGITSWGSIKTSGTQLMAECLKRGSSTGGQIFVTDSTAEDPVLVIWMWASGANFEAKLNQYESDPSYSPQLLLSAIGNVGVNGTNGTLASAGASASAVLNATLFAAGSSILRETSSQNSVDIS